MDIICWLVCISLVCCLLPLLILPLLPPSACCNSPPITPFSKHHLDNPSFTPLVHFKPFAPFNLSPSHHRSVTSPSPNIILTIPPSHHQSYFWPLRCLLVPRSHGIPLRFSSLHALLNWARSIRLCSLILRANWITFNTWDCVHSHINVHGTKHDAWCSWPAGWRFSHVK